MKIKKINEEQEPTRSDLAKEAQSNRAAKKDSNDPIEKALGKAKKGHPGGLEGRKADLKKRTQAAAAARKKEVYADHTEYKRIGLVLAEALGVVRVDEIAPVLTGLVRGAGMVAKMGAKAGANKLKDKAQGVLAKDKKDSVVESNNQYVRKLMEEMPKSPIATKFGDKRMKSGGDEQMRDRVVKSDAQAAQKRVDQKLGTNTNIKASDAVQLALNKRRARTKKGLHNAGEALFGRRGRGDSRADARQDAVRQQAPGDK